MSRAIKKSPEEAERAFDVAERALAAELGLAHDVLKDIRHRHLEEGLDWRHLGNAVHYSPAGRAKALDALKIAEGGEPPTAAAAPQDGQETAESDAAQRSTELQPGDQAELICTKRYQPNRQIVEARHGEALVRVRMKDNRNMRPGMIMRCRYTGGAIWELAQKCPRYPGKW